LKIANAKSKASVKAHNVEKKAANVKARGLKKLAAKNEKAEKAAAGLKAKA